MLLIIIFKGNLTFDIFISAVKRLIVINRIQNKSLCLHNICLCTVIFICDIIYMNINTSNIFFTVVQNICCMCFFIYTHNKYTQYD